VLCALLFAAMHGYPPGPTIGVFLCGLFLGWLFWIRRSLWCLVLGHWLCNLYLYLAFR
jgi:membrane protease YdiL (CAAX protease family)